MDKFFVITYKEGDAVVSCSSTWSAGLGFN